MDHDTNSEGTQRPAGGNRPWEDEARDIIVPPPLLAWQDPVYEAIRYAYAGFWLGGLAGCTSLLVNVVGSVLWPAISGEAQHPLRIIQVYLTFPVGESALQLNGGLLLALGCLLYLGAGMLYGMLFELAMSYYLPRAAIGARLMFCSVLALAVWVLNFYGVLIWLQPLLFGGRWIIDLVPWWVGAVTHLVFGWTMALIYPLGKSEPVKPSA